jgi:hypothetical protein
LVELGVDALDAAEIIAEAALIGARPTDAAAERRRAYDRERKRKSTGIPPETAETEFHRNSTGIPPEKAASRVENITLPKISTEDLTTQNDAREISGDELRKLLLTAGSPAIDDTAVKIHVIGPMLALLRPGTGPPCDLDADMLDVVRAKSKSRPPKTIRSWDFFREAIIEARDKRLQQNPKVTPLAEHRPRPAFVDPMDAVWAESRKRLEQNG